ncbi:MAG: helix-turn-helix transcriptional regulator [Gemmatimonas sp.]|nr:helix-turn-helix transcriptional regulator [Gemmatimonas sp.]
MDASEFGQWLREARKSARLSQEKAGQAMGVSGAAVSGWESGENAPDPTRYSAIESTYGLASGVIAAMQAPALEGPSLDYWVGRWEQQTLHFRRLLADQELLLTHMRQKAAMADPIPVARQLATEVLSESEPEDAPSRRGTTPASARTGAPQGRSKTARSAPDPE